MASEHPLLAKVKVALRVSQNAFDGEITDLINAALDDMGVAGVINLSTEESGTTTYANLAIRAVITYCRMHFGHVEPKEFDRLKLSYDEQKAQLVTATGYTDWTPWEGQNG